MVYNSIQVGYVRPVVENTAVVLFNAYTCKMSVSWGARIVIKTFR